ncbi:MAG: DUF1800 domain-containing protein [Dehalococcoidia bacterium]|nr:hypothetical protein [Chloroflexota bacterium]MCD5398945.1 DUF1800 domain-containing protein [Dehalococcoidia bacterium]
MVNQNIALMAHLMRRAGFGATRDELEALDGRSYEATVEELLHPETSRTSTPEDEDLVRRYHVDQNSLLILDSAQAYWIFRMVNTSRPLEEKIALFWHGLFATGYTKLNQPKVILSQIDMFRRRGLGSFRDLLVEISKDPAMIFWLDNKDNHKDAVNENYGREILELFTMGVGNYTEDDVRQSSRAFTGWNIHNSDFHAVRTNQDSVWPYGRIDWQYEYRPEDHDNGEKQFLGQVGDHNGEDVIDIICRHPATARFIARHLYNFFVADEPQVPAWDTVPPRDPHAIETLAQAFVESGYNIRATLRVLFNSNFFKESTFAKVKSPVEMVVGTARTAGGFEFPNVVDIQLALQPAQMGQQVLDPPSVEGWHTGVEWVNTASLVKRVNFAVGQFSDTTKPGVNSMIDRIASSNGNLSPDDLVESCLDILGPMSVSEKSRDELVQQAADEKGNQTTENRIRAMLQMIVSTREYQMA